MPDYNEIKKIYETYWKEWYKGKQIRMAALNIIYADQNNTDSGYSYQQNIIKLCISEDTIPTDSNIPEYWPIWKIELIHEMIHEYQYKVITTNVSFEGKELHTKFRKTFSGTGHEEDFFTAICHVAIHLNIEPERLIKAI